MGYYIDYFWTQVANNGRPYSLNTLFDHDYFIANKGFFWDLSVWDDEVKKKRNKFYFEKQYLKIFQIHKAPNDDPHQKLGTDLKTLQSILLAAYQKNPDTMIHIGGFTPWLFKYVDTKHPGVATEWQTCKITSAYNAYVDADACCLQQYANAAFLRFFPLNATYTQNPKPTINDLKKLGYIDNQGKVVPKTFIMFYVGDYDSASWLY